ncbi:MAG: hypothetical protein E7233_02830 [Lachnospiraceae bacterium]|nr:hypothetical protein [Lachnospiraceae bacterium]
MTKTVKILIIMGALLMISLLCGCHGNVKVSGITSFSYRFTTGNMVNADVFYGLEYKNGNYTATVKPNGEPEQNAKKIKVDKSFEENLRAILEKYKVSKWNGFNKTNKMVLDGNSFYLDIYMEEGDISAHGYMSWPNGYADFKDEVTVLFESIQ